MRTDTNRVTSLYGTEPFIKCFRTSGNHRCRWKAKSIKYYNRVSILAFAIRHRNIISTAQHYVVICDMSGFTFQHYLITNGTIFMENLFNTKGCFDSLYRFCLEYFSFYEEFSELLSSMYIGRHIKYRRYSWQVFNKTWNFSIDFRKKKKDPQIRNFTKICPVGADLFYATMKITNKMHHID